MKAPFLATLAICLFLPTLASAQLFGTYTTAAVSSEGEGGFFVNAGSEKFQTGVLARFQITRRVDFGLQLGFDRECSVNSYGWGLDFKVYLLGNDSEIPVDFAIDGYYGHLRSKDYTRNVFGVGLLLSGVLQTSSALSFEPYASFMLITTYFKRDLSGRVTPHCFWPDDNFDESTRGADPTLRGGINIGLSDEHRLLLEVGIDGGFIIGGALNIIF